MTCLAPMPFMPRTAPGPISHPAPDPDLAQISLQERARLNAILLYLRDRIYAEGSEVEHLHAVFLGADRQYLADRCIGSGHRSGLALRMRSLFALALQLGSRSLIVAHNHPSGDCRPSPGDIAATRRMAAVAQALDIKLLDHLIITPDRAYSMRAGGAL